MRRSALAALCVFALLPASLASQAPNPSLLRPETSDSGGGPLRAARERAEVAVAHVYVEIDGRDAFKIERPSSGVLIGPKGYVVTCLDLVREAVDTSGGGVSVRGVEGKRVFVHLKATGLEPLEARVAEIDVEAGLALLRVEGLPAEVAERGLDLASTTWGQDALVLSLGDGETPVAFAGIVTESIGSSRIAARPDSGDPNSSVPVLGPKSLVMTDAAIQQRNHGGALVDRSGRLLGLCNASQVVDFEAIREPSLEQLKQPSFGFAVASARILSAFDEYPIGRQVRPAVRVEEALLKACDSVVTIYAGDLPTPRLEDPYAQSRRASVGSGVLLTASGLIFTNSHLCPPSGTVKIGKEGLEWTARVVANNRTANLALLQIDLQDEWALTPIATRTTPARVGERVYAIGRPVVGEQGSAGVSLTSGVVSALRAGGIVLQTDARLGNENGGGALVDSQGRLIGVVDGGRVDRIDVAYARRGDGAKVENSLNQTPSLELLEQVFRDELAAEGFARSAAVAESSDSSLDAVVERVAPSMLNIYIERLVQGPADQDNPFAPVSTESQLLSLGSGVVIDAGGLALSNWHVVDAATFPDGSPREDYVVRARNFLGEVFEVTVLSISREEDLALLQLELDEGQLLQPVTFGSAASLSVGDRAIAAGNPEGNANSFTVGVITATEQKIRVRGRWAKLSNLLETDAAINGGNSGGALLDSEGRLIGINSAGGSGFNVTGYAISVDHVRERLQNLLLGAYKMRTPWLGLRVADRDEGGVYAQAVDLSGPAATAGVERGDRILSIDGEPVVWSVGFALQRAALSERASGSDPLKVQLVVERDGEELPIELVAMPHEVWLVRRELGHEVSTLSIRDEPDTVRDAAVAFYRDIVGDPTAEPRQIPGQLLRVQESDPDDVLQRGDLLLGVRLRGAVRSGGAAQVVRFEKVRDVHDFVSTNADYDGVAFETLVFREGAVVVLEVEMTRLLY